jgi:methylenetetrahydrofolate--tRNA-(uracil-5-)-methyltransferase
VEGYLGNMATGLLAGVNAARVVGGEVPLELPRETMLGALCHYVAHASPESFQPMKANFGIMPSLEGKPKLGRRGRAQAYADRSREALERAWPRTELELHRSKGALRIAMLPS